MAVVGDAWRRLPVRDGVLDRVVVAFAPRNGPEVARVLSPDGRLVVLTPAPDHLGELVGPLGLLRVDPDKPTRVAAALEPHLCPVAAAGHREVLALDRAAVLALVGMGPHAHHVSRDAVRAALETLPEPVPVTVSVEITTYEVAAPVPRGAP
jgi:23S rRNA (guanine745-N1)-methyltransferase